MIMTIILYCFSMQSNNVRINNDNDSNNILFFNAMFPALPLLDARFHKGVASFLDLVKPNQIWIVVTIVRLIWYQTIFHLVPYQSEKCNYNPKLVWFNRIQKIFLHVWIVCWNGIVRVDAWLCLFTVLRKLDLRLIIFHLFWNQTEFVCFQIEG